MASLLIFWSYKIQKSTKKTIGKGNKWYFLIYQNDPETYGNHLVCPKKKNDNKQKDAQYLMCLEMK